MCFMGIGRLHVVEGSMNNEQYINVIKSRLIPQVTEWYQDGNFTFLATCLADLWMFWNGQEIAPI